MGRLGQNSKVPLRTRDGLQGVGSPGNFFLGTRTGELEWSPRAGIKLCLSPTGEGVTSQSKSRAIVPQVKTRLKKGKNP